MLSKMLKWFSSFFNIKVSDKFSKEKAILEILEADTLTLYKYKFKLGSLVIDDKIYYANNICKYEREVLFTIGPIVYETDNKIYSITILKPNGELIEINHFEKPYYIRKIEDRFFCTYKAKMGYTCENSEPY